MTTLKCTTILFFMPLLMAPTATPGFAAVRHCFETVSSELVTAPTELEAKKKAIQQWQAKAEKIGKDLGVWRLAAEKALKCFPKNGGFECVAFGEPCTISQNPNRPPKARDSKDEAF